MCDWVMFDVLWNQGRLRKSVLHSRCVWLKLCACLCTCVCASSCSSIERLNDLIQFSSEVSSGSPVVYKPLFLISICGSPLAYVGINAFWAFKYSGYICSERKALA